MAKFLIIAAGSAMGRELADLLRNQSHQVVTTARNSDRLMPDHSVDAADFDAIDQVFAAHPDLDGAVCLAGSLLLKPAHLTTREQFDAVMSASLATAFATVRAAGRNMKNGGSVVLVSSAAALEGLANHEAIAAAKAGVVGLMQSAAATYAPQNLRFNAIAPGLVETPLTAGIVGSEPALKASLAMHPLGRIGTPGDIARAIAFLLDPLNDWISGQVLAVDGGLSRLKGRARL